MGSTSKEGPMQPERPAHIPWDYPAEDDVAETLLHLLIRTLLMTLTRRYLASQDRAALVGSDQFVYWEPANPHRALAPDLYVVLGKDPDRSVRVWKTWEDGAPNLVVEVVSVDRNKDYVMAPLRYEEMGVDELIVFDPHRGPGRIRWQVYRRDENGLCLHTKTDGDRVRSGVLGCHLVRVEHADGTPRVRLGTGADGGILVPTPDEEAKRERAAKERERAAKERERAAKERERAAKERERAEKERERAEKERERALRIALEAEVATLRQRLAEREG
jgi:Uma2 family endonuclease